MGKKNRVERPFHRYSSRCQCSVYAKRMRYSPIRISDDWQVSDQSQQNFAKVQMELLSLQLQYLSYRGSKKTSYGHGSSIWKQTCWESRLSSSRVVVWWILFCGWSSKTRKMWNLSCTMHLFTINWRHSKSLYVRASQKENHSSIEKSRKSKCMSARKVPYHPSFINITTK